MPLYRPTELRDFLDSINKKPVRFSSQNFLIDGNVVGKIVSHVVGKNVLEIGPGPGVLTEVLVKACNVVAVEKDPDFANALCRLSSDLIVLQKDILECSLEEISQLFPAGELTVVSNLPYHLTTPIIEWLLASRKLFSKAVLMVQKEAAQRLTAKKGGLWPVFLSYCGDVRIDCIVSKNSFWPKPAVDSAVITFEPFSDTKVAEKDKKEFFDFLKILFSNKRKTILHQLCSIFDREKAVALLEKMSIPFQARPENLSLEDFLKLR